MIWRLDPRCELAVLAGPTRPGAEHEDLGCGLQGPASRAVRRALDPLRTRIRKMGAAKALTRAAELTQWIEEQPAYSALCTSKIVSGRHRLKERVLYDDPQRLEPRVLQIRHGFSGLDYRAVELPIASWAGTHDLLSLAVQGVSRSELARVARQARQTELLDTLIGAGWLAEQEDDAAPAAARQPGIWFIGHNTVLVASRSSRILFDPWFRPWRDADPADYRPLRPADLGPIDAVAITHSHGDHFHLGSLLAYPRDTPIFVPHVERESILATDLQRRLTEVGFTRVRTLPWWSSARIGDITVRAMPFFGEQASAIDLVDPSLRNVGNTWFVETPGLRTALLADTGRDPLGNMQDVALKAHRQWGPADLVFGTMRGFVTSPLMLPFTTLDAMFVNAPIEVMGVRQQLMNNADNLLAVTELFGAKYAVPYADGGAPWYFREGMGPAYHGYPEYPGERPAPEHDAEDPASAPFPERLNDAIESRYSGQPLVESLVLRPGDLVRWRKTGPAVGGVEGFAWPFADQ